MHYGEKRGLAVACRPFVSPSVGDVGGSGSHSLGILKLIERTISPTPSLFVAQSSSTYSSENTENFWGD